MKLLTKIGFGLLSCTLLAGATGIGVQATSISTQKNAVQQNLKAIEPIISNVSKIHYNVVRVALQAPIDVTENYINIVYGQNNTFLLGATPVYDEDGQNYIAFDINLDLIARNGLNTQEVTSTLAFVSASYIGGGSEDFSITNNKLIDFLLNATDEGGIADYGSVNINTLNITPDYNKYLSTSSITGGNILNGKITTLTHALEFTINDGYVEGYQYKLTNAKGDEVQRVFINPNSNQLFINLGENTFNNEQYTLSVQKEGESDSVVLMTFTPFYIF